MSLHADLELMQALDRRRTDLPTPSTTYLVFHSPADDRWSIFAEVDDKELLALLNATEGWTVASDHREYIPDPRNPALRILRTSWPVYTDAPSDVAAGQALSQHLATELAERREKLGEELRSLEAGPLPSFLSPGPRAATDHVDKLNDELTSVMASEKTVDTKDIFYMIGSEDMKRVREIADLSNQVRKICDIVENITNPPPTVTTTATKKDAMINILTDDAAKQLASRAATTISVDPAVGPDLTRTVIAMHDGNKVTYSPIEKFPTTPEQRLTYVLTNLRADGGHEYVGLGTRDAEHFTWDFIRGYKAHQVHIFDRKLTKEEIVTLGSYPYSVERFIKLNADLTFMMEDLESLSRTGPLVDFVRSAILSGSSPYTLDELQAEEDAKAAKLAVTPMLTLQQLTTEVHNAFSEQAVVSDVNRPDCDYYPADVYVDATAKFAGRKVRIDFFPHDCAALAFGDVVEVEAILPGMNGLDFVVRLGLPGPSGVMHALVQTSREHVVTMPKFIDAIDQLVDSLDTIRLTFEGEQIRFYHSVRDSEKSDFRYLIRPGEIATCTNINFVVDKKAKVCTISLEGPHGPFTHTHPLQLESTKPPKGRKKDTMAIKFNTAAKADIVRGYKALESLDSLADLYGCSAATIKNVLVSNGVKIRGRGRPVNLVNAYNNGAGLRELSAKTNLGLTKLRATLAARGVKIRGRGRIAGKKA